MSLLFGIGGVMADIVYTVDWWHPQTLTDTRIGLEAWLCGFFAGGAMGFAYGVIFSKQLVDRPEPIPGFSLLYLGSMVVILFFATCYLTDAGSFVATILAFAIPVFQLLVKRPDLIPNSLFVALFSILLAYSFIWVPELLTPGWVDATWQFEQLSGLRIGGVPVEDFVWFILGGAFMGHLYNIPKKQCTN